MVEVSQPHAGGAEQLAVAPQERDVQLGAAAVDGEDRRPARHGSRSSSSIADETPRRHARRPRDDPGHRVGGAAPATCAGARRRRRRARGRRARRRAPRPRRSATAPSPRPPRGRTRCGSRAPRGGRGPAGRRARRRTGIGTRAAGPRRSPRGSPPRPHGCPRAGRRRGAAASGRGTSSDGRRDDRPRAIRRAVSGWASAQRPCTKNVARTAASRRASRIRVDRIGRAQRAVRMLGVEGQRDPRAARSLTRGHLGGLEVGPGLATGQDRQPPGQELGGHDRDRRSQGARDRIDRSPRAPPARRPGRW